ncbi:MAG TPA: glycosyltransferase family 4 protein [Pyrinomonadaceae bacterium]|nr:glycosyltransferase family 4 protein [Pyrinomonadaceae bacterium]
MRILQISSAKTFGGGERHVVDLARELQGRGHEVFVAVRPTSEWQDRLSFVPPERFLQVSIRNSFGVFSAKRIANFVKENNIEIVHAHVARDYIPASIACMAAKPAKFVITRHVLFPLKPFNRFALKNLSAAIGVSDAVGLELRKVFPFDKVQVIPNGLDVDRFNGTDNEQLRKEFRELHCLPLDAPIVGTLGELKELKGQRDFVLAAHEVIARIPEARFVIVGKDNSSDRSFRRDLKRLVKVLGMDKNFLWLDWLDDTSAFFAGIDLFVSPSHSESFGLAMLEAMARGKAIVATSTEGAKQLMGSNGMLVPVNDAVGLANGIVAMLMDDGKRAEAGAVLKRTAAEKYSLEKMIDKTEHLYISVKD